MSNFLKYFHLDNLPFVYVQFYKHSCQNILADNNLLSNRSKESIEMTVKDSCSISSSATFKPRKLV